MKEIKLIFLLFYSVTVFAQNKPPNSTSENQNIKGVSEIPLSQGPAIWKDPSRNAEERAADLVRRMTKDEKIAQLIGIRLIPLMEGRKISVEKCRKLIPNGIGHISQFGSFSDLNSNELIAVIRDLETFLGTQTRLGIPTIFHDEAITGLVARGVTTYPQQIGMACTWNPELLYSNVQTTRELMRKIGAHQALSPMLDICRDAHCGRIEESFGEDPYLTSRMGLAFVTALQGNDLKQGVAATIKHFAGYAGGITKDIDQSANVFREESLRPFEVAIRFGKAQSVMSAYSTFHGVPNSASKELLTNILRRDLEFDGSVVSDYGAVEQVYTNYQYAKSLKEAAGQCLNAGLDVDLESGEAFKAGLLQSIEEGAVLPATLDSAVTRQLVLKIRLGMLDPNSKLFSSKPIDFDPPTNRKRAYISACQSLVLLKNEGNLLPLQKSIHSIALVGPNAADVQSLLGDYTYQTISRNCSSFPTDPNCPKLVTILEGLQSKIGDEVKITHARGCDWVAPLFETSAEFQNAIVAANQSDVIVAVMGENGVLCGEGHDRADVRLPGQQEEFIRRLAETGKPIVLVICGGRPPILTDIAPFCRSIVMAWYSGEEGGNAMADLLTGAINPSGKLTVTLPRSNQQSPICYSRGYKADDMPLYPFGYGISYTTYGYSGLKQPATVKTSDALIPVTFTVENTGTREGTEIVQLYISSKTPLSTYPKMELVGFARVSLNSGRKSTVTCRISPQQLAHYDKNMRLMIEPGQYEVLVGASSTDIRLKGTVTLSGAGVLLPKRGAFFSETRISPQKKF